MQRYTQQSCPQGTGFYFQGSLLRDSIMWVLGDLRSLLSEAKSSIFLEQLQEFKVQLEEKVSNYLAEELEAFVAGFDLINTGIASGDSDMVIQGNMQIQSVLGRQPQFTNQSEFDSLMESDMPLLL